MQKRFIDKTEYRVLKLLGKGKSGYSYLAQDPWQKSVVIKQIHHEPCSYYTFGDKLRAEEAAYARLKGLGIRMPVLLAVDHEEECLIKEFVPGSTVFELVDQECVPPEAFVQMEQMCRVLYRHDLNIDYFPTNFIWRSGVLHYVDYECNPYSDEWNFENWGKLYWSKTPEYLEYVFQHSEESQGSRPGSGRTEDLLPDGRI